MSEQTQRALAALMIASAASLASTAHASVPAQDWGTYLGGPLTDEVYSVAVDAAGNVYAVGNTSNPDGFATPGAHRTTSEKVEGFLVKFGADGERLWGTYIGGAGDDYAVDVAVRGDDVVIVGSTTSAGLGTPGAFQPTLVGSGSGFAVCFTPDGALKWGTYLGPTSARATVIDGEGGVYVAGVTESEVPGLTTPQSHQPNYSGGDGPMGAEVFLARLGDQGQRVWGTYYGGDQKEEFGGGGLAINEAGELYLSGSTESTAGIASPEAFQAALAGAEDGFLARFTTAGVRVWGTYYGGVGSEYIGSWVTALPQGGAVLAGLTTSTDGISTPGAYQGALAGQDDDYVVRFDAAGARVWGTYVGGFGEEGPPSIAASTSDAVYVVFSTESDAGIATVGALQGARAGEADMGVVKFDVAGQRVWGSYFGGPARERFNSVATFGADVLVLAGNTRSSAGIATPGAFDTTYAESRPAVDDAFIARFSQVLGGACDGPDACNGGFCVDGVCCDSACGDSSDDCQVCSAALGAAADGVCTRVGADVVCRPSTGPCDPAERCSGRSDPCPDDAMSPDGEVCDAGLCIDGQCVTDGATEGGVTDGGGSGGGGTGDATGAGTSSGPGDDATSDGGASSGPGADGGADGCGCNAAADSTAPLALLLLSLGRRRRGGSANVRSRLK